MLWAAGVDCEMPNWNGWVLDEHTNENWLFMVEVASGFS